MLLDAEVLGSVLTDDLAQGILTDTPKEERNCVVQCMGK